MSSFLAEASVWIDAPPEVAFDKLADLDSWAEWMPRSFRPAWQGGGRGTMRAGDRLRVHIARLPFPTPIEVYVVDRANEITWGGGSRLLAARHRFLFEPEGKGTRVRSVETWQGLLDGVARRVVLPLAERIGAQQIGGLKRGVESSPRPR